MSERRKRHVEKMLAGGRKRYVLLQGGLKWGLFVATVTTAWKGLHDSGYSIANIDWSGLGVTWLVSVPLYFVGGCVWGHCMWEFFAGMREDLRDSEQSK